MMLKDGHYYRFSKRQKNPQEVVQFRRNMKVGEQWGGAIKNVFVQLSWTLEAALEGGHYYDPFGVVEMLEPLTEAEAIAYKLTH